MESSFSPHDAVDLLGDLPGWWVAGGWAIDLWLGEQTMDHVDLDVATLRKNQRVFWTRLDGWDLHLGMAPDVVEPWPTPGKVPESLHAVWCRPTPSSPWAFEVLLNDSNSTEWLFRRDHRVRLPLNDIGLVSDDGIPYLAPEIVLLYKAKNVRSHDVQDFETALPGLSSDQKGWMRRSLDLVHPGHPWSSQLIAKG